MMDVPSANQSQAPCQSWADQNGWSTSSPPGRLCDPLPSFQHLNLGSPSRPCYDHLHASTHDFQSGLASFSPRDNTHHTMLCVNNAHQSVQHIPPDPHASSMIPTASHGRNAPLHCLPLQSEGTQPCTLQQMPLYSSQAVCPPLQPLNTHQGLLNGPQSPHQSHLPISPPLSGYYVNQCPQSVPPLSFEGETVGSSVRYTYNHTSPTSPVQQQPPQWTLPPQSRGNINEFVPSAAAQSRDIPPQSPNSESRYGLDPELLPSAVKVMSDDKAAWEGKVFVSEPFSRLPPLATTSCIIEDRGNASPSAIRFTSYSVPCEGQSVLLSHLPLGGLVTPLAKLNAGEKPIPLCKETESVSGCGQCGASMCPAMSWQDCGQRFYCPFCGKLSEGQT